MTTSDDNLLALARADLCMLIHVCETVLDVETRGKLEETIDKITQTLQDADDWNYRRQHWLRLTDEQAN